jgi:glycosyltransferase involved in cell wall biosynthesis
VAYFNALGLAKLGHEVEVFTANYSLHNYQDPEEIIVNRMWTPLRFGNAPFTPELLISLADFDLIHLHWPFIFGAELTWMVHHFQKKPYVVTYHMDLRADRKKIFGPYQRLWGPRLVLDAERVIAVTSAHLNSTQVNSVLENRPELVSEIPNGVETNIFHPGINKQLLRDRYEIPASALVIVFVGAMDHAHEYKGVPDLLRVFQELEQEQLWLLLVGGGDLLDKLHAMAAELLEPFCKRVVFTGEINHHDLPEIYAGSDICVLPSLQPESFGMVLIEAMACGLPCVASDSPGTRSVVIDQETGFLFPIGDRGGLCEALNKLCTSADLRHRMGKAGARRARENYSWEKIALQLEELYFQVLKM